MSDGEMYMMRVTPLAFFFDADNFTKESAEKWLEDTHKTMPPHTYAAALIKINCPAHAFILDTSAPPGSLATFSKIDPHITLAYVIGAENENSAQ